MKIRSKSVWGACVLLTLSLSTGAAAQSPSGDTQQPPAAPPQAPVASDPDRRLDPLQPDFNLAALPTTLRLPKNKMAFRVTHRFTRSLGSGDFGDLLNDFFGFDSAAQIGLELRYGLLPGTQIGVHRTSDKTIEIFGQQKADLVICDIKMPKMNGITTISRLREQDRTVDAPVRAIYRAFNQIRRPPCGRQASEFVPPGRKDAKSPGDFPYRLSGQFVIWGDKRSRRA